MDHLLSIFKIGGIEDLQRVKSRRNSRYDRLTRLRERRYNKIASDPLMVMYLLRSDSLKRFSYHHLVVNNKFSP